MTSFCARCSHRFAANARCPACDAVAYDLTTVAGRKRAVARLRKNWRKRPARRGRFAWIAAGVGLTAVVAVATPVIAAGMAGLAVAGWLGWRVATRPPVDTGEFPMFQIDVCAADSEPAVPRGRITIRGTVRMRGGIRAPVCGEEVAAFRLFGSTPDGPIDDGAATRFEIMSAEDLPVVVEGASALVDLAPGEVGDVDLSSELATYLHHRSPFRPKPPVLLAESVLRDGDPVEVIGSFTERAAPAGYRDNAWQKVMIGSTASPLVIGTPGDAN